MNVTLTIVGDDAEEILQTARHIGAGLGGNVEGPDAPPVDLLRLAEAHLSVDDVIKLAKRMLPDGMTVEVVGIDQPNEPSEPEKKPSEPEKKKDGKSTRGKKGDQPANSEPTAASPAEAKAQATEILFSVFKSGPEGEAAVQSVLQKFGVDAFKKIPEDKGHELLAAAKELQAAEAAA